MNDNSPHSTNSSAEPTPVEQSGGCPHPSPEESQKRWAAWHQAMELSHEMLLMGLRQQVGPNGDLAAAYRAWYERYQALKWDSNSAS